MSAVLARGVLQWRELGTGVQLALCMCCVIAATTGGGRGKGESEGEGEAPGNKLGVAQHTETVCAVPTL